MVVLDRPPVAGTDPEALFEEARRRRRRRRLVGFCVILAAAALASAAGIWASGSSKRPTAGVGHRHPGVSGPPARSKRRGGTVSAEYSPAQSMGRADGALAWVATGSTLEITSDGGLVWRTITPPNLSGVSVSQDVTAVNAVGTDDLWVVITDVPGLVTPNGGSSRGEGIDESTDGGKSWVFVSLPGCIQNCGPIALSMVDVENGYAVTDGVDGGRGLVFSTQNGGASWARISTIPSLNGVEVSGPIEQSQLLFTSAFDGWAVPGPTFDPSTNSQVAGGTIYHTTDGGALWSAVPGLPSGRQYTLPEFFGSQNVVTLGTRASGAGPTVYVSDNGGSTWSSHMVPAFLGSQFSPGGIAYRFAAVGPRDWKIDVGSELYQTANSGTTWTAVKPHPAVGVGNVMAIVFSSPTKGMALGVQPSCPTPSAISQTTYCGQVLTVTTDGGVHWEPAKL